jgi:tetratricopeptide (TPR) repeat protein
VTATPDPVQAAEKLVEEGSFEEAIRLYSEALAQAPADLSLLVKKAYALWAAGRMDEALGEYDKAIGVAQNSEELAELWRYKGIVCEQKRDFEEALRCYEKALSFHRDSRSLWADKADVFLALGRFEEALATYKHAAGAEADVPPDWTIWGDRFNQAGRAKEAKVCYDAALKLNSADLKAWWGKGLAMAGDDVEASLRLLSRAAELAEKPEDQARILTDQGNVLAGQPERAAAALVCYSQAIERDPQQFAAHAGRAVLLENDGQYAAAVAAYDHVIRLEPGRAEAWEGKGRCLTNLPGKMEEALVCYQKATELDPNSFSAHADGAWVLMQLRRFDEAIAECDIAIGIDREAPAPWTNKGFALMERGKLAECEQLLTEAIAVVRDPVLPLTNLSLLYSDYKFEEQKGLEVSRRLLQLEPTPTRHVACAELLLRLGDYSGAREEVRALQANAGEVIRSIGEFIRFASYALEGNLEQGSACLADLARRFSEEGRKPVTEKEYYFRGLTKRVAEGSADPMEKFAVLTVLDLLTGKLKWSEFSFREAVPGIAPSNPTAVRP